MSRIKSIVLSLLAIMFCAVQPAHAETRLAYAGSGVGDRGAEFRCPPGKTLVGFGARGGLWVVAVSAICAPLQPDGKTGQGIATDVYFGGATGTRQDVYCPRCWTLSQTTMTVTRDSRQLAAVYMICRNQSDGRTDNTRAIGNTAYVASCKPDLFGIGDCPILPEVNTSCPLANCPLVFTGGLDSMLISSG